MKKLIQILILAVLIPVTVWGQTLVINEVDADQESTDTAEFIELFDGGGGNTDLTGLVLVLFNGSNNTSYQSYDLDGLSTNGTGYFVFCNLVATVANCDYEAAVADNLIQNGADAVALYTGDATAFPSGTPVTTDNLIDAFVYDTSDDDDVELLVLLNAGQPQVDENGGGDKDHQSSQRIPNGAGGQRNTDTFVQAPPTPGAENATGVANEVSDTLPSTIHLDQNYPNPFNPTTSITYALSEASHVRLSVTDILGRQVSLLTDQVQAAGNHQVTFTAFDLPSGVYISRLEVGGTVRTNKMVLLK